jgi:hypothetical protein
MMLRWPSPRRGTEPMKPSVLIVTLLVTAALVPVAVWADDVLVVCLAGLIPFFVDLKNGDLD